MNATDDALRDRLPLRWAGGKRELVPILARALEHFKSQRVVDPFMGGGSFSLGLHANSKIAADQNFELINFMRYCKRDVVSLIAAMAAFDDDAESYYKWRELEPDDDLTRSARFLYLNRTSYMGLHRTNRSGKFNVPYGGGERFDLTKLSAQLTQMSIALRTVDLHHQDFRETLKLTEPGDFVIADPPYGHSGDTPFRRYGRETFAIEDHSDLANELEMSKARGALGGITLPADPALLHLYEGWWRIAERRGRYTELLLLSEPVDLGSDGSRTGGWKTTQIQKIV
jgi:DNA adenine methylase